MKGYSLLELVIVMAVFAIISTTALLLLKTGQDVFGVTVAQANMEDQARRVVEQLANEIQQSSVSRLSPVPPDIPDYVDYMTYQINTGYSGGAIQWSTPISLAFQYAGGETDDGIDNNHNGLIDEGFIVRTQNSRQQYVTYWVKDDGFRLSLDGNKLRIYVGLQNTDNRGNILGTTAETIVEIKNPAPK